MQSTPLMTAQNTASAPATPSHSLTNLLKAAGRKLLDVLILSSELQVQQIVLRGGTTLYSYDPKTGQRFYSNSEAELLNWIENSYRHL